MADFFVWDPKTLSVDVAEMDDEHIELIRKMNALHAAHARGAKKEELAPLFGDLATYATKHFADEEAYMARVGYAWLESHKLIHKKLLTRVGEHAAEFEKAGVLTDAFFSFLAFWLTSHIRGIDAKYSSSAAA